MTTGKYNSYFHFLDKKTEAQNSYLLKVTLLVSGRAGVQKSGNWLWRPSPDTDSWRIL